MLTTLPFLDSDDENGDTKNVFARFTNISENNTHLWLLLPYYRPLQVVKFTNVEEHNALGFLLNGLIATKTTFINTTNPIFHLGLACLNLVYIAREDILMCGRQFHFQWHFKLFCLYSSVA